LAPLRAAVPGRLWPGLPGLVNVTKNDGKSPFLMCKPTISMAMFNSYVTNYQRVSDKTSIYSDNEMEKDGELN